MKKISIIGATGFGGIGLIEILLKHPKFELKQLIARKDIGSKISDIFPHLNGHCDLLVEPLESIDFEDLDLVFFSTPDKAGMSIIKDFFDKDIPVIDFSGDFRFTNLPDYEIYAQNKGMDTTHTTPNLLEKTVYGLAEKNKEEIKKSKIVGNPGCFAISSILASLPVASNNLIEGTTIICDGKTGVSGAGRSSGENNLYPQRYENINSYREAHHQHTVEVENILTIEANKKINLLFIPQIIPINRGILTTLYIDLTKKISTSEILELYTEYYKNDPFVEITDRSPGTADVKGSNRCLIKPFVDERTGKLVVISVIDNLLKGQSGNAVQNANIMMGFEEDLGIDYSGNYP